MCIIVDITLSQGKSFSSYNVSIFHDTSSIVRKKTLQEKLENFVTCTKLELKIATSRKMNKLLQELKDLKISKDEFFKRSKLIIEQKLRKKKYIEDVHFRFSLS